MPNSIHVQITVKYFKDTVPRDQLGDEIADFVWVQRTRFLRHFLDDLQNTKGIRLAPSLRFSFSYYRLLVLPALFGSDLDGARTGTAHLTRLLRTLEIRGKNGLTKVRFRVWLVYRTSANKSL